MLSDGFLRSLRQDLHIEIRRKVSVEGVGGTLLPKPSPFASESDSTTDVCSQNLIAPDLRVFGIREGLGSRRGEGGGRVRFLAGPRAAVAESSPEGRKVPILRRTAARRRASSALP